MNTHSKNKIDLLLKILIISVSVLVLAFIVSMLNKGFRFSDEGYYLQGYTNTQSTKGLVFAFHDMVRLILGKYATHITLLRTFRVMLILTGSAILSHSVVRFTHRKYPFLVVFPLMAVSLLASFVFGPQSLSYNSINQFLIVIFSALCLYLLSCTKESTITTLTIIIAIIVGSVFYIKITTSAILALLLGTATIIHFPFKQFFKYASVFVVSLLLWITGFKFLLNTSAIESYFSYFEFLQSNASSHDSGMIIGTLIIFVKQLRLIAIIFLLFFILTKLFYRYLKPNIRDYCIITLLLIFTFAVGLFKLEINHSRPVLILVSAWIGYIMANLKFTKLFLQTNKNQLLIILLLMAVPVAGAIGSDVGIFRNTLLYFFAWVIIPVLLASLVNKSYSIIALYSLSVIIFLSAFTFKGVYAQPFRMEYLPSATVAISNPYHPSDKVFVTEAQARTLSLLKEEITNNGYKKGDYIWGLTENIGDIFFLQGKIPGGLPFSVKNLPFYFYVNNDYSFFNKTFIILSDNDYELVMSFFEKYNIQLSHNEIELQEIGLTLFVPSI